MGLKSNGWVDPVFGNADILGPYLRDTEKDSGEVGLRTRMNLCEDSEGTQGELLGPGGDGGMCRKFQNQSWRSFVKNPTGSDIVVKIAGDNYVFEHGKSYCCQRQELGLILEKGVGLVEASVADYLATGEVASYTS